MNTSVINKTKLLQIFMISCMISISLTGGDCEKTLSAGGSVPQELVGSWKLIVQSGALQDICDNEIVNFQSNSIAVLTCPNSNSLTRSYTIQSSVLSYTETSIEYEIEFSNNNNTLSLFGRNVSRNLQYEKIITDEGFSGRAGKNDSNNSSEERKHK